MDLITKEKKKERKTYNLIYRLGTFFLVSILIMILFIIWNESKSTVLSQIDRNTSSKISYYAKEIELKYIGIEVALNSVRDNNLLDKDNSDTKWIERADFYIQNFEGIESIMWADRDFIIKKIAPDKNNEFSINQSIKNISPDIDHLFMIQPTYSDNELTGFLFGKVNVVNLVLSITREAQSDYMIQIYNTGVLIYSSENWDSIEDKFARRIQIDLKNANSYEFILKPSNELVRLNISQTNKNLIYGCFLALSFGFVLWIARKYSTKSRLLVLTQNNLIENQAVLEEKNSSLQFQLRNQQKLESIGILASGIAHEINNPINGILNYSQLIMDSSDIKSENIEYTKEIIFETERVAKIVKNLLQFSREGKDNFSYARIEDIIDRSTSLIQSIIKKDLIELKLNVPEDLPEIKCRSQQIQQVLINLLTNARDALNDKFKNYDEDKIINITAEIIEEDNKSWVRITVEDHGKGIPLSVQSKIFNQFFTTKEAGKGTGLGLAISYGIVKEHNGNLTFETVEDKYTKFYLDLPVE